jgi:hypothetical protein
MRAGTFRRVRSQSEITRKLAQFYAKQISLAGPIMGALWVYAYLDRSVPTPIESPIGARLTGLTFVSCDDIQKQLVAFQNKVVGSLGKEDYDAWRARVTELCTAPDRLFAVTVPLFVEGQMKAIHRSPHPAQDALIGLLSPIVTSQREESPRDEPAEPLAGRSNAQIIAVLHAGRVPYVLTCHPAETVRKWSEYLEAATVLLLPQVVAAAQATLSGEGRKYVTCTLRHQVESWTLRRPEIGEEVERPWLPSLL